MKAAKIRDFDQSEYGNISALVADRDGFLLLFEIVRASKQLSLVQLCGRFRVSPEILNEVFDQLVNLNMAVKQAGIYKATALGHSAIDLIEEVAKDFKPAAQTAQSNRASLKIGYGDVIAATNNSVRGTFSSTISAINAVRITAKPVSAATDGNATAIKLPEPDLENASRNHDYM